MYPFYRRSAEEPRAPKVCYGLVDIVATLVVTCIASAPAAVPAFGPTACGTHQVVFGAAGFPRASLNPSASSAPRRLGGKTELSKASGWRRLRLSRRHSGE